MKIQNIHAFISFTRAYMSAIIGLTATCGFYLTGLSGSWSNYLLLFVAQGLVAAAGFACNDILDRHRDAGCIHKPLSMGRLNLKVGKVIAGLLATIGLTLCSCIHPLNLLIGLAQLAIVYSYSWIKLKSGCIANLVTAGLCASGFVFGSILSMHNLKVATPIVLCLFIIWAREMVKDILDVQQDSKAGLPTVPVRYGLQVTAIFVFLLIILAAIISLIPTTQIVFGSRYTIIMSCIDAVVVPASCLLLFNQNKRSTEIFLHVTAAAFPMAIVACLM